MPGKAKASCQTHDAVRLRTGGPRQPTRRGDADLVRVVEDVARHLAQLSRKAEKVVRKPVEYRL